MYLLSYLSFRVIRPHDSMAQYLRWIGCLFLMLSATTAWGHQCRFYKPDQRNLCLAQKEEGRFYCNYIKNSDQKSYCFAYVDRNPQQCNSIADETLKTKCSTEVKIRFDEAEAKRKAEAEQKKANEAAQAAQGQKGQTPSQATQGGK